MRGFTAISFVCFAVSRALWRVKQFLRKTISVLCAFALAFPVNAFSPENVIAATGPEPSDTMSAMLVLAPGKQSAEAFGLRVRRLPRNETASLDKDVNVLVHCGNTDLITFSVANVSSGCGQFSIISSAAVTVEVPYDPEALPRGVAEEEIKLYKLPEFASTGPMRPIDSHVDLENKKTVATLSEQAGQFFNGVLKSGERPDRPPVSLSGESLEELQKVNPVAGVPIIAQPQTTPSGDLVLNYPLDFPGVRPSLKPSIGVQYSAQSPNGNIGGGWSLSVPAISVETRWGVPQFDPNFETETYLFNGEQLVPEAGAYLDQSASSDSFDNESAPPADQAAEDRRNPQVRLVPMPHRTTSLRPRKRDNARFVLRRDEGLWRFVRHGDTPSNYWWEAWQENPQSETVKISYFGNAPGRISSDITSPNLDADAAATGKASWILTTGPVTTRDPASIMRWGLAREKDAFGNIVDYDWMSTCATTALQPCNPSIAAAGTGLADRDLYLKRIIYYSHDELEETILRCMEDPSLPGCKRKQGAYEITLSWSANSDLPGLSYRSEARSGGLTVPRRLLSSIDVRFRQRETEPDGTARPVQIARWFCSDPIAVYRFNTIGDPLFSTNGMSSLPMAPRWLQSIEKLLPESGDSSGPVRLATSERAVFPTGTRTCGAPATIASPRSLKTVFAYKTAPRDANGATAAYATAPYKLQAPVHLPSPSGLIETAGHLLEVAHGAGKNSGPFRPSFLGSTKTEETSGGVYIGISIGNASKAPGAGYKSTYNGRTDHQELTLLQDVTGDSVTDLLVAEGAQWAVYPGVIGTDGHFSFAATKLQNTLPTGFRFQYEPAQSGRYSGFEAHLAPGAMAGFSSGDSSSLQTVYMSDMDGDGRIDVITPNGVFYNGSGDSTLRDKVGFASGSRYISPQAAFVPDLGLSELTAVKSPLGDVPELKTLTLENPRYDTVRTWRAPFKGLVWIRGAARIAAEDDKFGFADTATGSRDPNARNRKYMSRDGVIVSVEHSSGSATGHTNICDAFALSPSVMSAPQVPSPDPQGTWRIAGSTRVKEFALKDEPSHAQYMVSVAGLFGKEEKTAIDLQLTLKGAVEGQDFGDFSNAVASAVTLWRSKGNPGTLEWSAGEKRLTYSGVTGGSRMEPLLIEVPVVRDQIVEIHDAFVISLAAAPASSGVTSSVAVDQGSVETEIFEGDYTPRGTGCVTEKELAEEAVTTLRQKKLIDETQPGLLATVDKGDLLYMRINSIDNGNEDIVQWDPSVTYLRAEEDRTYIPADEKFPFDPGTSEPHRQFRFIKKLLFDFTNDKADAVLTREGTLCQGEERGLKLCDVIGRSLVRYKSTSPAGKEIDEPGDTVQVASATGEVTAQFNGKITLDGSFAKPETAGLASLEYSVLPAASAEQCRVDLYGARNVELYRLADDGTPSGETTLYMTAEAARYQIAPGAMNSTFVNEGDRICLFLRYGAPRPRGGQAEDFGFWPKDAARISFDRRKPVSVRYQRYLEVLPRDPVSSRKESGPDIVPAGLCFADDGVADLEKDPPEVTHADFDVPGEIRTRAIQRPKFTYRDQSGVNQKAVALCRDVDKGAPQLRSLVMPRVDGVSHDTLRLSSQWGVFRIPFDPRARVALELPVRMPVARPAAIPAEPAISGQASSCAADNLVRTRFSLDLKAGVSSGTNPAVYGRRVATIRYSAIERMADGRKRPAALRPFAIIGNDGRARQITTSHLTGSTGTDERTVEDRETEGEAILQDLRLVRGSPGTAALTRVVSPDEPELGADKPGLSSDFVGYSTCLEKNSTLEIEAAISPPASNDWKDHSVEDNLVVDHLIGRNGCLPFSDQAAISDAFDAEGRPAPGSRQIANRICPIMSADVRFPLLDKVSPRSYEWSRREIPFSYPTNQLPYSDNNTRVRSLFDAQNHRGSALLAVRYEDAARPMDLPDEVDVSKSCLEQDCITHQSANLRPLPTLKAILAAVPPLDEKAARSVLDTVAQGENERCSAKNTNNGMPPNDEGNDPLGCGAKKSTVNPLLAGAALAYPLPVAIKAADPRKGALTCNGIDLDFSDSRSAAAGPSLSDRQNLLSLTRTGKVENEAKATIGLATSVDVCHLGPDPGIWAEGDLISSSRLGMKDIHQGLRGERARLIKALAPAVTARLGRSGMPTVAKSSSARNTAMTAAFVASAGWSTARNQSPVDVIDMNGDGFPDLIAGGRVTLTDPGGGLRCSGQSVWNTVSNCANPVLTGQDKVRASASENISGTLGYPSPTPTYVHANTASNGGFGNSTTGIVQAEGQGTNQPRFSGLGASIDLGTSRGERRDDILDMNGDGLPDIVRKAGNEYQVSLNLGGSFAPFQAWPASDLFRDIGTSAGAGINASYSTPDGAFGGGLDAGIGTSDQNQTIADVNGDGLNDIIYSERAGFSGGAKPLYVRLSTGSGFTDRISLGNPSVGDVTTLGRSETDRTSTGGQFSAIIPIWPLPPIFLVINPNFASTSALTRQPVVFRDIDSDGLPDLVVGHGARTGNVTGNLGFSNESADIISNGLSGHGLLTGVWLPTNPAIANSGDASTANYAFRYARTSKTLGDPYHRWTLAEVSARDGMDVDDSAEVAADGHRRRTCYVYDQGFYDRYERRFLGYGRIDTIEGCAPQPGLPVSMHQADVFSLKGTRRVERHYANRTVYETGLVLEEKIFDLSAPIAGTEPAPRGTVPQRWKRNAYILVDTALSNADRFICERIRTPGPADDLDILASDLLKVRTFGAFSVGDHGIANCRQNLVSGQSADDPSFDSVARRLTPALVQTVSQNREGTSGPASVLVSALQVRVDNFARATSACELGEIDRDGQGNIRTSGATCSNVAYDQTVKPAFTHGATGGGILQIDQRNRVKEVQVYDFKAREPKVSAASADSSPDTSEGPRELRRRTASYDPATGSLMTLCEYGDLAASENCNRTARSLPTANELEKVASAGVVMESYRYDAFGNLTAYLGPMGSQRSFTSKRFLFDSYLNLVETAEQTSFCINGGSIDATGNCPGASSYLGELVSASTTVDYRHAVSTTLIDTNQNVLHRVLDPLGRPVSVFASWGAPGPECAATSIECAPDTERYASLTKDKPVGSGRGALRKLAQYRYEIANQNHPGASAVVERYATASAYRDDRKFVHVESAIVLPTRIVTDQLGDVTATVSPADICTSPDYSNRSVFCATSDRFSITGIQQKDSLGRPVAEFYPTSTDQASIAEVTLSIPAAGTPAGGIRYDGLDRPLLVSLPDGNGYDFQYRIAVSLNASSGRMRHRTEMRNALCVPSAIERDVRGSIRTVVDTYSLTRVGDVSSADIASSAVQPTDQNAIAATPFVSGVRADVTEAESLQQIQICDVARGEPFPLGPAKSATAYEVDALGQLVAVDLPNRKPSEGDRATTSQDRIYISYDSLGRRTAIDDPDRGFERSSFDPAGNVVCTFSGERRGGLTPSDLPQLSWSAVASANCPAPGQERKEILRKTAFSYVAGLLTRMSPEILSGSEEEKLDARKRSVETAYGRVDATTIAQNAAGRVLSSTDASGREMREYDALGRTTRIERDFAKLEWKPTTPLVINELYDSWGPLISRTLNISVPSRSSGSTPLSINETVRFSYTVAGQPAGVSGRDQAGNSDVAIADGFRYDSRGNRLGLRYGTGIDVRARYATASNRLVSLTATMGRGNPDFPALKFQDLLYNYDAAGNVLAYDNVPGEVGECEGRNGDGCSVTGEVAQHYRLLVHSSMNSFSYDQLNRVRTAEKKVSSTFTNRDRYRFPESDREGQPQVISADELQRSRPVRLAYSETFAYDATHQMAEVLRNAEATVGNEKPVTRSVVARYEAGTEPRHAPAWIRSKPAGLRSQDAPFTYDKFGRMESECSNDNSTCKEQRLFYWNVDDTLRTQITQVPDNVLPYSKHNAGIFYDHINSEFDGRGQRVYKKLSEYRVRTRSNGTKETKITPRSETLYADPQLTITRGVTGAPQAVIHYFAGDERLASRWVGDENLFTYHQHLLTRNVSDIAIGEIGTPSSVRLHSQTEYAAFGEVIHERENTLAGQADGTTSRTAIGLPQYRFNAKELDESRLQDFGARFYDPRSAIWLRPDPILSEYLNGAGNGGVYTSKNLSAYSFGWNNPISFRDIRGQYAAPAEQGSFAASAMASAGGTAILNPLGGGIALDGLGALASKALPMVGMATIALSIPGDTSQRRTETLYVTYTRNYTAPDGTTHVYSGRTSGEIEKGSPEPLKRSYAEAFISQRMRSKDHNSITDIGFGDPKLDKYSLNYGAIRGREQLNIDKHGGAAYQGGSSANLVNGISEYNPFRERYLKAAKREFPLD